jgi:tRNA(adenine34) deaminase
MFRSVVVSGDRTDRFWMGRALQRARSAGGQHEVPIGALVVHDGRILGAGWNRTERDQDALGSRRLVDCTLYVTLEPCAMCAGAIVLSRIPRLVFGAYDPKAGACGTLRNIVQDPRLNHTCQIAGGVLHDDCAGLLQNFFGSLRAGGGRSRSK